MWVQQLEDIPYATAALRDPKAVQRWAAEHVAPADAVLRASRALATAREQRARALVEQRKAQKKERARERNCDRHYQIDQRPQILREPPASVAPIGEGENAAKPATAKRKEPTKKKSQRDQVWQTWSEQVREAEELLKVRKETEQARRIKPEKVQAFRHALDGARLRERACDVHDQYILKWQRENAPAEMGEGEVQGVASEAAKDVPTAAATGAPTQKEGPGGKEGGGGAERDRPQPQKTKDDKWKEQIKAVLFELRPSAPESVKMHRRRRAGLRRLAEARLHSPAARLLTPDARLDVAVSVLYSEGGWPDRKVAQSEVAEAEKIARELVRAGLAGVRGDGSALSNAHGVATGAAKASYAGDGETTEAGAANAGSD
jgi:hypothetical protein